MNLNSFPKKIFMKLKIKDANELIDNWLKSEFASSITYFRCPVSFYCKLYSLRLKEPAEVEENINPMTFGNLAHSILEKYILIKF